MEVIEYETRQHKNPIYVNLLTYMEVTYFCSPDDLIEYKKRNKDPLTSEFGYDPPPHTEP